MSELHEPTLAVSELRPTHLEVDLAVLADNYAVIADHVRPASVMPILKANAYGHGLVAVARKLESVGAPCVGVAYLEEGLRLRQEGVRMPVLVLGGIVGSQIPLFLEHDLSLTASSVDNQPGQIRVQASGLPHIVRRRPKQPPACLVGVHHRIQQVILFVQRARLGSRRVHPPVRADCVSQQVAPCQPGTGVQRVYRKDIHPRQVVDAIQVGVHLDPAN
jgi:hypothetical protein